MSFGPIFWLYLAEVATYKGMSIAVVVSWIGNLVVSATSPFFFNELLHQFTFMLYGVIAAAAFVFFLFFMKETKDLSMHECKRLYSEPGSYQEHNLDEDEKLEPPHFGYFEENSAF